MNSTDAALATRPEACSACNAPLDALGRCSKCGAVFGEAYRCPLCQALSDIEPSTTLYYRCRTCGGPRIPPTDSPLSEAEVALLRSARSEQLRAGAFQAGSGFAVASGVLSLLITGVVLLVTTPPAFAKFAAVMASLIPFVLSLFAWRRAQSHKKALQAALQQAWFLAASRAVTANGGQMSPEALARALKIDQARAELLLAEVSVQDFVQPPAELAPRMRVTELADPAELSAAAEQTETEADFSTRKP